MIINGSVTIRGQSSVTSGSKVIYKGSASINGKSNVSIFWLNIKGNSSFSVTSSIIQRNGRVSLSGGSSLIASLVKVGKPFFAVSNLSGEFVITSTLEGGGEDYMKTDQDFSLVSGDYHELHVQITDESGNPKDISGCNFVWAFDGVVKTNGNGITITDAPNGSIVITMSPEDTQKIYGTFIHQARMTDAQNHPTAIFEGKIKIDRSIA